MTLYEEALRLAGAMSDPQLWATALACLGRVQLANGDVNEAGQNLSAALPVLLSRPQGEPAAAALAALAECFLESALLRDARETLWRLSSFAQQRGIKSWEVEALLGIARVLREEGEIELAAMRAGQACVTAEGIGDYLAAGAARLIRADIELDAGREGASEHHALLAVVHLGDRCDWALALVWATVAAARQRLDRPGAARRAIRRALDLGAWSSRLPARLRVRATASRLAALLGKPNQGHRVAQAALREATRRGLRLLRCECLLALAEIDLRTGGECGLRHSQQAEREAKGLGLSHLASRAGHLVVAAVSQPRREEALETRQGGLTAIDLISSTPRPILQSARGGRWAGGFGLLSALSRGHLSPRASAAPGRGTSNCQPQGHA